MFQGSQNHAKFSDLTEEPHSRLLYSWLKFIRAKDIEQKNGNKNWLRFITAKVTEQRQEEKDTHQAESREVRHSLVNPSPLGPHTTGA